MKGGIRMTTEQNKKKILIDILYKQFEFDKNFKTDWNLPKYELIDDVKKFLADFIEKDIKTFYINVYFIQGRQYQDVTLYENGKNKYIFNINRTELAELIK